MSRHHPTRGPNRISIRSEHGATKWRVHHARLQVPHGAQATVRPLSYGVRCGAGRGHLACKLLGHLGHAADRVESLACHAAAMQDRPHWCSLFSCSLAHARQVGHNICKTLVRYHHFREGVFASAGLPSYLIRLKKMGIIWAFGHAWRPLWRQI